MRTAVLAGAIVGAVVGAILVLGLGWYFLSTNKRREDRRSWNDHWDSSVSSQGESSQSVKRGSFMRGVPAYNYSIASEKVHPNPVGSFPARNGQPFVTIPSAPPAMTSMTALQHPTLPNFPASSDVSRSQSLGLSWSDSDDLSMSPGTDGRRLSVPRSSRQYSVVNGDDREKSIGRQRSMLSTQSKSSQTPLSTQHSTPLQEKIDLPSGSMPPLPALPHPLVTNLESYGAPRPGRGSIPNGGEISSNSGDKQKKTRSENAMSGHGHSHNDSWNNKGRMSPSSYFTAMTRLDSSNDDLERQQVTQILESIAEASTPKKGGRQSS